LNGVQVVRGSNPRAPTCGKWSRLLRTSTIICTFTLFNEAVVNPILSGLDSELAMDDVVYQCEGLSADDVELLRRVERGIAIAADVSRSDLLLYSLLNSRRAVVVAQAAPHSIHPIYLRRVVRRQVTLEEEPYVFHSLLKGRRARGDLGLIANGAPIVQDVLPVRNEQGRVIGALSFETNLLEHERHRRRSKAFQVAVRHLQDMVRRGGLSRTADLSPFGEHDGILVVDSQQRVAYASGIATGLFRRRGRLESLVGRRLSGISPADSELVGRAIEDGCCVEEETQDRERIWVRKALVLLSHKIRPFPIFSIRRMLGVVDREPRLVGVMLLIHDATEARRKERELKVKSAMIQEIHHRVKNNLQVVAALLRIQSRRSVHEETRLALLDAVQRILSVAVVHEFLSEEDARVINIRELVQRIIAHTQQGMLSPDQYILLRLEGHSLYLPAQQATTCAIIVNELIQNAVEHAFGEAGKGEITVRLGEKDDVVQICIVDDGRGLPEGFTVDGAESLGLQIVRTLVQDDLKGEFRLQNGEGTKAIIRFPRQPPGGEASWSERE
jgi:two-component sensor histidine kinase